MDIYLPQPVRTLNNGDAVVQLCDATTPTQKAKVDSSGNQYNIITNTTGSPVNALDASDGPVTPGTVATYSSLCGGQYNTSLPTLTTGQQSSIQIDSSGRILISQPTASALNATVVQSTASNLNALVAQGAPNTLANAWSLKITDTTNGPVAVKAASTASIASDPSLVVALSPNSPIPLGTNLIGGATIYVGVSAASNSNPVPVSITNTPAGTIVNKYNTTAALAANSAANHVYTITSSKTFSGRKFWASGSGKIRADVQTSPDGSTYTTYWSGFSSPSFPNINIDLDTLSIQDSGTGSTIRIIITNEDTQSFDVFSTISGQEN